MRKKTTQRCQEMNRNREEIVTRSVPNSPSEGLRTERAVCSLKLENFTVRSRVAMAHFEGDGYFQCGNVGSKTEISQSLL
jgi:hypothetical protein